MGGRTWFDALMLVGKFVIVGIVQQVYRPGARKFAASRASLNRAYNISGRLSNGIFDNLSILDRGHSRR